MLMSYLNSLSSKDLHATLLANGEVVCDLGILGVSLCPGKIIPILGDICEDLVDTALLDDAIRDS